MYIHKFMCIYIAASTVKIILWLYIIIYQSIASFLKEVNSNATSYTYNDVFETDEYVLFGLFAKQLSWKITGISRFDFFL